MTANKLPLKPKKFNSVIFHPLTDQNFACMFENENKKYVRLESKVCVKYLGALVDQNLSWKYHIDSIVTKISKNVELLAKLRQSVPRPILLNIYKLLIHLT